jgi:heme/copper-type cytochrome/quinol oxidase subunit 1
MWAGLSGAALATMIRLEMAYPGSPFFKGDSLRYLQVMTAHGLIMVFFVVVPIFFGGFANFLIPYHIGSKDVAFPRLNSIGFWIQPLGFIVVAKIAFLRPQLWRYYDKVTYYSSLFNSSPIDKYNYLLNEHNSISTTILFYLTKFFFLSFFQKKISKYEAYSNLNNNSIKLFLWENVYKFPETFWSFIERLTKIRRRKIYFTKCSNRAATTSGWTFITPFSSNTKFTAVGAQDILIIAVILAGISTTISFTNLLITRRTLVTIGLRNRRILLPFITISLLLTLRILVLITPVLGAAFIMAALDRHWKTSFFDFSYGGDPILFQHLFWFFGHPEVYVLIIPSFGFINMIIPFNNTRRMASKHHMVWAIYIMAYMGFIVWGHHMYLVGLDHRSRNLYSTITIMISLPATIKLANWTMALSNGALKIDTALLFGVSYIFIFLVGGLTGMWLSHVGLNVSMHDTFYVVAHFHLMLAGAAMTGAFAGFYYYFTAIFGIRYSLVFSYLHVIYYSAGIWLTFLPLFYLGFSGLPRRIHDFPLIFLGWQSLATTGHGITLIGVLFFFFMLFDSHIEKTMHINSTYGIPRFHKRIQYYIFKSIYASETNQLLTGMPSYTIRLYIINNTFNEYESFNFSFKK